MESPLAKNIDERVPNPKLLGLEGFKHTQVRRSLRHVIENESKDELNFPSPQNLPPLPVMDIIASPMTNTRGNDVKKKFPFY